MLNYRVTNPRAFRAYCYAWIIIGAGAALVGVALLVTRGKAGGPQQAYVAWMALCLGLLRILTSLAQLRSIRRAP